MELGVQTMWGFAPSLELARWAETEGLAAFAVADHFLSGDEDRPAYDQITLLGAIARETESIRLATLVSPLTFRHPAVMLKAGVTLDEVSGGRFGLGVGTGWMESEHRRFGLDLPEWSERFERLEEALEYLRAALAPEPTGFEGSYYRLEEFRPRPLPGDLEIIVGGSGPRRTPALAGRYADEFNVVPSDEGTIAAKVERARRFAREAGRDPQAIRVSTAFPPLAGRTRSDYRAQIEAFARGRGGDRSPEDIERRFEALGIPHGTPDRLAEGLERLGREGVQRVYLQVAWLSVDEAKRAVEAFRAVGG